MSVEIETLANASYGRDEGGYEYLDVEVNGRPARIFREKALRLDGEIASLGSSGFEDFFVIIPASEKHGIHSPMRLEGYTNDRRYVALIQQFVDAADNGRFRPGPVKIPT